MPDAALHLRPSQELRHARPLPRRRRGRMLTEEARATLQLQLIQLCRKLQVRPRRDHAPSNFLLIHPGM
eukprot:11834516-Alexandrium_andersonii.AAC.1